MISVLKEPRQQISPNAVKMWQMSNAITNFFVFCIIGVLLYLHRHFHWVEWIRFILYIAVIVLIIISIVEIFILPIYRQRTWRYEIDEQYVQLKYGGAINKTHLIIPMTKVQYVNTYQGPILQKFGLSTITIGTMASSHEIPAINETEAIELREKIAFLAQINEANE